MVQERDFAYVQARVQARHGARPSVATWRYLDAAADLAGYLHGLRETSLAPWVRPITPSDTSHDMERTLRGQWSAYTRRIASWAPSPWRPAIACLSTLPQLPALEYLRHSEKPLAWLANDPQLKLPGAESMRENRLDGWLSDWRRQWPHTADSQRDALGKLQGEVITHLKYMDDAGNAQDGDRLREQLEALFKRNFRRYAQNVIAVFCHLGLTALDVERMRGGLITRILFAPDIGVRQ